MILQSFSEFLGLKNVKKNVRQEIILQIVKANINIRFKCLIKVVMQSQTKRILNNNKLNKFQLVVGKVHLLLQKAI